MTSPWPSTPSKLSGGGGRNYQPSPFKQAASPLRPVLKHGPENPEDLAAGYDRNQVLTY